MSNDTDLEHVGPTCYGYLIYLDSDGVRLGPDTRGEYGEDGWLWLTSPHTGDTRVGVSAQSLIVSPDGRRCVQLPIIQALLESEDCTVPIAVPLA